MRAASLTAPLVSTQTPTQQIPAAEIFGIPSDPFVESSLQELMHAATEIQSISPDSLLTAISLSVSQWQWLLFFASNVPQLLIHTLTRIEIRAPHPHRAMV
jgi:hypothetical protein